MQYGRPVAVLGGVRIPFCRQNTAYADVGNLGLSVRTLGALVVVAGCCAFAFTDVLAQGSRSWAPRPPENVVGDQPGYERVVITEAEGETVGFCVDKVIGRQQAVIKSLDDCYRHLKWISGTTINGDGSISLILDVPQLVRFVRSQEDSRLHAGKASRTLL